MGIKVNVSLPAIKAEGTSSQNFSKLGKTFDDYAPNYTELADRIKHALIKELNRLNIKYLPNSPTSRIKSFESFTEKIERKKYTDPFNEIEDICGVRLVILYRSDLSKVAQLIKRIFNVHKYDGWESRPINEFGYMSDHFIITLGKNFKGPLYDDVKHLKAEIQVRTVLMDAWGSVSHHLSYKKDQDIPEELKKDFYALSGLFYVADTHFEILRDKRERYIKQKLIIKPAGFDLNQDMNLDSFAAYLNWKYPKRKKVDLTSDSDSLSELMNELINADITNFIILNKKLDTSEKAFKLYEQEKPPTNSPEFSPIGVVRVSLELADDKYLEVYYNDVDKVNRYKERYKKYRKLIKG
jgi:putative GTP pyrophosphokinase